MAILKKRRATSTLPEVTSDRGILVSKDAEAPLTSKITGAPAGTTTGAGATGVTKARPKVGKQTIATRPSGLLTSAIKGGTSAVGSRPAGVTGAPKTGDKITTKLAGTERPTLTKKTISTGGASKLTSALSGALLGAGAGVAGKMVYDKLFGTKTGTKDTTKGGTKDTTKGTTKDTTKGGTKDTTKGGTKDTTKGGTTGGTKGGTTGGTKGGTTGGTKGGTGGTKGGTGGTKGGAGGAGGTKGGTKGGTSGGTKGGAGGAGGAATGTIRDNEDGTKTQTFDDGSTITYDADGNIIATTPATDIAEPEEDTGDVVNDDGSITHSDGSTTYTYDDGSTITVDADGNVVSATDAEGETVIGEEETGDETGTEEDTFGGVTDDEGNTTYTYDDGSTIVMDADGNVISYTDGYGNDVDVSEEEVATEDEYYEDDFGNLYDANGDLMYDSNAGMWTDDEGYSDYYSEDQAEEEFASDDTGSEDVYYDDSEYAYDDSGDYFYEDSGDYSYDDSGDYSYEDGGDYSYDDGGDWWGKKGGLVALMKQGGDVRAFQDGGDEGEIVYDDEPVDAETFPVSSPTIVSQEGDPYYTLVSSDYPIIDEENAEFEYFDDGSYIVHYSDGSSITYDSDGEIYQVDGNDRSQANAALDVIQMSQNSGSNEEPEPEERTTTSGGGESNVQVFDDGSRIETFDDGSTITYDSDGNIYSATDVDGNVIKVGGGITSGGSGGSRDIYTTPEIKTGAEAAKDKVLEIKEEQERQSTLSDLIDKITGSEYLGAGAAGAVLGALLSNSDLFGGGTGERNAGIDMSKVGVIPARTTEFGIGPAKYVTYGEYGARDQMPDLYGTELYRNLNAPGFNPVREGDYGYVEEDQNAVEEPAGETEEVTQGAGMAEGGMATGGTYFTFGRPVDPLQNLNAPMPAGQMGGGLNSQKPQMPAPEYGMQPMKKGGLPAVSNVPMTSGRLDFRHGSSVHGPGDGQSDDIPAMLADGEYVIDAETVAQIGNGSTKAGAKALDEFRQNIRKHKRSAPLDKIPPKTKTLTSYLKKGK